jgi:hypothetical protein
MEGLFFNVIIHNLFCISHSHRIPGFRWLSRGYCPGLQGRERTGIRILRTYGDWHCLVLAYFHYKRLPAYVFPLYALSSSPTFSWCAPRPRSDTCWTRFNLVWWDTSVCPKMLEHVILFIEPFHKGGTVSRGRSGGFLACNSLQHFNTLATQVLLKLLILCGVARAWNHLETGV